MFQALKTIWRNHGSLLFSGFNALAGMLEYIDQNTINLVGGFFGPHYGPMVSRGIQVGCGLLVAHRSYRVNREPEVRE